MRSIYIRQGHPSNKKKLKDLEKCVVKVTGIEEHTSALRKIHLHLNWELLDGLVTTIAPIPNGALDWFQPLDDECR